MTVTAAPEGNIYTLSRAHKTANLFAVGLPPAALVAAIILLWNHGINATSLWLMVGMYLVTAFGITFGYHRLFTHRSFQTSPALKATIAVLGSMAVEGSVITWVSDHRKHHAFADVEGDPHSPHLSGDGFIGALKGLWHAHMGWLFETVGTADRKRFAPDLLKDPLIRKVDELFLLWVALGFAIPFALGWAIDGSIVAGLSALLWAGLVRVFFVHHITWSVNSVCHFVGRRRFDIEDGSTNVFWLAPFSLGESWHHNHHAFPTSAFHGLTSAEKAADPTGLVIAALEKLGLVWKVVRISPERQAAKLIKPAAKLARAVSSGATASEPAAQAVSSGAIVNPAESSLSQ